MNVANNNKPMNIIDMHVENYAPLSDGGPSNQEKQYYPYSHIGCDETGSGDFFGPLCVVACYIDERDYDWLASLNVRDPKLMTPQEVIEIAREIKDRLVYSLLILDNSHYNQMAVAGNNLANIKAKLYNQAVTNVMQKVAIKVDKKVVNQFVSPKTYYNYLKHRAIFHTPSLGDNSNIGANAVVLEDVPEGCIAVGVPARIIRKKEEGEC